MENRILDASGLQLQASTKPADIMSLSFFNEKTIFHQPDWILAITTFPKIEGRYLLCLFNFCIDTYLFGGWTRWTSIVMGFLRGEIPSPPMVFSIWFPNDSPQKKPKVPSYPPQAAWMELLLEGSLFHTVTSNVSVSLTSYNSLTSCNFNSRLKPTTKK